MPILNKNGQQALLLTQILTPSKAKVISNCPIEHNRFILYSLNHWIPEVTDFFKTVFNKGCKQITILSVIYFFLLPHISFTFQNNRLLQKFLKIEILPDNEFCLLWSVFGGSSHICLQRSIIVHRRGTKDTEHLQLIFLQSTCVMGPPALALHYNLFPTNTTDLIPQRYKLSNCKK